MGAHLTTDSSSARPVLKDMQHWFTWKICGKYVEHIIYTFRSKRFSIFLELAKKMLRNKEQHKVAGCSENIHINIALPTVTMVAIFCI
jgi:hypothetical protein